MWTYVRLEFMSFNLRNYIRYIRARRSRKILLTPGIKPPPLLLPPPPLLSVTYVLGAYRAWRNTHRIRTEDKGQTFVSAVTAVPRRGGVLLRDNK